MVEKLFIKIKKILPLIGVTIFLLIIYNLDMSIIIKSLFSINPIFILFSITLTIPRILLRNYSWQLIQKEQKIKINFFSSLKIFLIGYFYGSITPGYMGQLMRIPYLKEKTNQPYGKLFVNSTIETIVHTFSMFVMILIGTFLVLGSFPELFIFSIGWFIFMILLLFYFIDKERGDKLFQILIKYLIPKKFKDNLSRFIDTFYCDFPRLNRLLLPIFIGLLTWIIIFSQEYIIIYAMNIDIPYLYFLLLFPVANAVGFIPISFAGLGTRELTSIIIFSTLFGIGKEEIFVFTLIGFVITDIFTGLLGFFVSLTDVKKVQMNKFNI